MVDNTVKDKVKYLEKVTVYYNDIFSKLSVSA